MNAQATQTAQAVAQLVTGEVTPANEETAAVAAMVGTPGAQDREWVRHEQDNSWSVLRKNKDGTTVTDGDKGHIPAIEKMDEHDAIIIYLDLATKQGSKREAALSLLCNIFEDQKDKIEPWQGHGNPTEGLDRQLNAAFQGCELRYFGRFMNPDHPDHKLFKGRLPTTDSRNKPLTINGKLVPEKQFEAFISATRADSTYSQFKSLCLQLFSYVGKLPYAEDGTIIPPEVIRIMVEKAKLIVPKDDSFRAELMPFYRTLVQDGEEVKKPTDDDLPLIVAMLEKMLETARTMENTAAIRRTARARPGDVVRDAAAAIEHARGQLASTGSDKMNSAQDAAKVKVDLSA